MSAASKLDQLSAYALTTALLVHAPLALANDTAARIGTGGLEFVKMPHVRMASEQLSISAGQINVRYVFVNDSDQPIETLVAFPMPEFGYNPGYSELDRNIGPLENFKISVGGQPIEPKLERKALDNGRDITARLRAAGLDDHEIFRSFGAFDIEQGEFRLAKKKVARLKRIGMEGPGWAVRETAYWRQRYPSRSPVEVTHSYKPLDGYVHTMFNAGYIDEKNMTEDLAVSSIWGDRTDRACVDEGARKAIEKRVRQLLRDGARSVQVTLRDVEYILGTGRNWKGPIGDFTLDLVKDEPDDVVSLCFPGTPTRVDRKTLRFRHKDFVPPDRLHVNFYRFYSLKD